MLGLHKLFDSYESVNSCEDAKGGICNKVLNTLSWFELVARRYSYSLFKAKPFYGRVQIGWLKKPAVARLIRVGTLHTRLQIFISSRSAIIVAIYYSASIQWLQWSTLLYGSNCMTIWRRSTVALLTRYRRATEPSRPSILNTPLVCSYDCVNEVSYNT